VQIREVNDAEGRPRSIDVRAVGSTLDLSVRFDVASSITTRMTQGAPGSGLDFLQMRGRYTVRGSAATRALDFTAQGSAETFRGQRSRRSDP
jgi:hypothetical protein